LSNNIFMHNISTSPTSSSTTSSPLLSRTSFSHVSPSQEFCRFPPSAVNLLQSHKKLTWCAQTPTSSSPSRTHLRVLTQRFEQRHHHTFPSLSSLPLQL
jgi:hypothetical protein